MKLFRNSPTIRNSRKIKILFIGNSLTMANDLPLMLQDLVKSSSLGATLIPYVAAMGGMTLSDHLRTGRPSRMIRKRNPDFVILQGHSTEPLEDPDGFARSATQFNNQAVGVGSQVVLFCTWSRPPGDSFYDNPVSGGSPSEMQRRVALCYSSLANGLGALLSPVGLAWELAKEDALVPNLFDGTHHPSEAGTFLAVTVLFCSLFGVEAFPVSFPGPLSKPLATELLGFAQLACQNRCV
jgi:hypothetical protein